MDTLIEHYNVVLYFAWAGGLEAKQKKLFVIKYFNCSRSISVQSFTV